MTEEPDTTEFGTMYVVLWCLPTEVGHVWSPFRGAVRTKTKEEAIKAAVAGAEDHETEGCLYRVVPESSWKDEFEGTLEFTVRRKR